MPTRRDLPVPRDRRARFVNWARTESSRPSSWSMPTSEQQVVDLVRRTAGAGATLRVVGAGHSWSRIAAPDSVAVSLDRFVADVQVSPSRDRVTVSAGMRLRDVSAALQRHGLSLPIVGSISSQSVAGAIATGTHGSSLVHGNLSDLVVGMRLVTGTGDVVGLDETDARLQGARVHLGALGVLTQVTLRCRDAGSLRQDVEHVPVAEVPGALEQIAHSAEYVKVWWLAHARTAQVVRYTRTDDPATRRPSARTQRWIDERVMHRSVFPAMVALQHRRPGITAKVNERLSRVYLGAASQVGPGTLMLNTPMPMRHRETEAAVPLETAPEAVRRVLALFRDGRPAVSFPLEIRFVRGDDAWLSPASSPGWGGDTCQIGAYSTNGPDCTSYFDSFWRELRELGARPHWGKELDHTAAELRPLYPAWDRFQQLRDELDPQRLFTGAFHRQLLGE